MTRKDKAGWLRSLINFSLVFTFLLVLHKLTTPTPGAFLGIASVVLVICAFRLIDHWQNQPSQIQHRRNAPATQDTHV